MVSAKSRIIPLLALLVSCCLVNGADVKKEERNLQLPPEEDDASDLSAIAYRCDDDDKEVFSERPMEEGDPLKICVEVGPESMLQNHYIYKINSFIFYKNDEETGVISQRAIDNGSTFSKTTVSCESGSQLCSFKFKLNSDFFYYDGEANGVGSVALQNGRGERKTMELSLRGGERDLQDYIGMAQVSITIPLEDGWNKKALEEAKFTFQEHFRDSAWYIRGLYIAGFVIIVLLICCMFAGIIFWRSCCKDPPPPEPRYEDSEDGSVDEINKQRDNSETYSVDNDDEWVDGEDGTESQNDYRDQDDDSQVYHEETFTVRPPRRSRRASRRTSERWESDEETYDEDNTRYT